MRWRRRSDRRRRAGGGPGSVLPALPGGTAPPRQLLFEDGGSPFRSGPVAVLEQQQPAEGEPRQRLGGHERVALRAARLEQDVRVPAPAQGQRQQHDLAVLAASEQQRQIEREVLHRHRPGVDRAVGRDGGEEVVVADRDALFGALLEVVGQPGAVRAFGEKDLESGVPPLQEEHARSRALREPGEEAGHVLDVLGRLERCEAGAQASQRIGVGHRVGRSPRPRGRRGGGRGPAGRSGDGRAGRGRRGARGRRRFLAAGGHDGRSPFQRLHPPGKHAHGLLQLTQLAFARGQASTSCQVVAPIPRREFLSAASAAVGRV